MSPQNTATALRVVGRALLAAGLVVLLFAGFQLWGTGVAESRSQHELQDDFAERVAQLRAERAAALRQVADSTTSSEVGSGAAGIGPGSGATTPTLSKDLIDLLYPSPGEPVARIVIPRIRVDKVVVEGVEVDDLRKGPGHFPGTPLPGEAGNAAIAGHRTTYGRPFGDIDQLQPGDEIRVSTVLGEAIYQVAGTQIVQPEQIEVIEDYGDNRLTLSACHPKYSAAERIIVWATLVGEPSPTIARPEDRRTVEVDITEPTLSPATDPTATTPTPGGSIIGPTSATTATAATASTTTNATADGSAAEDSDAADPNGAETDPNGAGSNPNGAETDPDGAGSNANSGSGLATDANQLAGDSGAWPGAVAWGLATSGTMALAWLAARRLERVRGARPWRDRAIYLAASPVCLALLFLCFTYVDRLLPAY